MKSEFFIGLPDGKTQVFCQPADSPVSKNGGIVVNIVPDCMKCRVGKCMPFEAILDEQGKIIGRRLIIYPPAYKI